MATTKSKTNMLWNRKTKLVSARDAFVRRSLKVELHVHIEGVYTLGPELQWNLFSGAVFKSGRKNTILQIS